MLTFKNTNIFFALVVAIFIAVDILYDLSILYIPVLLLAYLIIVFYGCYFINSNFFIPVFCSAQTKKKEIAITFDDGPAKNFTPEILKILHTVDVKAAFFCIGNHIVENEKIVSQIHDDGHLIGNHSYSHHFFFDLFSSKRMLNELKHTDGDIEKIIGSKPKLFRPPYGVTNPNLRRAIMDGSYIPVGWSVRSMDTVIKDEKKLLKKIVKSLRPGAVYLFHDTSLATVSVLPSFIKEVIEHGYEIVRLDKMLHLQPYA